MVVQKKGKSKVRLVIDAKLSNCNFASPPSVDYLTGEGLAGIEIELPPDVEIGSQEAGDILQSVRVSLGVSDVSDAFHRMRFPRELSRYFCLGEFSAAELGLTGTMLDGHFLDAISRLCPAAASLPMGFSCSLSFCQQAVVESVTKSEKMKGVALLTDRGGSLVLDATASGSSVRGSGAAKGGYVYVDNPGVLGLVLGDVSSTVDDISTQLDAVGLTTHERAVTESATNT